MKKLIVLVLASIYALGLSGCQKEIKGSGLYSFPEPTTLITGSFYSQGRETAFEIDSGNYNPEDLSTDSVIQWFYDLELTACGKPETVEGSKSYIFKVDGEDIFAYEDRGSKAYIIISGDYYKVNNPSPPPID